MNSNPHVKEAERFINEATQINAWELAERAILAANAQAIATLALTYEQRTANLIAAANMACVDATDWPEAVIESFMEMSRDISVRLGYEATK